MVLRNSQAGASSRSESRGCGTGATNATRSVVWSQLASFDASVFVVADNATGQTVLAAGGYRMLRNTSDAGACAVIAHNDTSDGAGTDLGSEFRWSIT